MAVTYDPVRGSARPARSSLAFLYQRETRQIIYQVVIAATLIALAWMIVSNTVSNLRKQNIATGFAFWNVTSGFDISQSLIPYSNTSTYGQAFWVGLWNTVLVSAIGIPLATIVGFVMGISRLSSNWLIAKIAAAYVEITRNVPLLLHLFVWYFAVIKTLPEVFRRDAAGNFIVGADGLRVSGSYILPGGIYLNNRGLSLPMPEFLAGSGWVLGAFIAGILASIALARWSSRRQMATGQRFNVLIPSLLLILALPIAVFLLHGRPVNLIYPTLGRFNLSGGLVLQPEFLALLVGLVFYTGGYIAEIVRAGIVGVAKGQKEAARALGLGNSQMLRLVVIPQALRIIIPPLTSNYLNLTKNSSLGVAIAYPEIVHVFGSTVLNQTNQAVECILVLMMVYLTLSLLTSVFMNWFNRRMALVER